MVDVSCNLVLLLGISNDFFTLQPKFLRFVVGGGCEFVVGRCAAKTALLRSVGAIGVFAVLEVEADLVEALLRYEVVLLAEIASVDDGVYELTGI